MSYASELSTFSVALGLGAHTKAKEFCRYHVNPQKAKQVYLNTLAVYAVNVYLESLTFETNLTASASWNPALQSLLDTADLVIPGIGSVECRPVLPTDTAMQVPPEVWSDRVGYLAVQLTATLREATLIGFCSEVTTEFVPFDQLQPFDALPGYLLHLKSPTAAQRHSSFSQDISLSQWLQGVFSMGWQTVEEIVGTPNRAQLAFNFRGEPNFQERLLNLYNTLAQPSLSTPVDGFMDIPAFEDEVEYFEDEGGALSDFGVEGLGFEDESDLGFEDDTDEDNPSPDQTEMPVWGVVRAKRIRLGQGSQSQGWDLIFAIGVLPLPRSEFEVRILIAPEDSELHLPHNLQLMVLDQVGEIVMQAQARETKAIQLSFFGAKDEQFMVKVVLNEDDLVEAFTI